MTKTTACRGRLAITTWWCWWCTVALMPFVIGNIKLDTISPKQLKNRFICSEHFELNQYSNPIDPKSRLNANAVPKLYYDLKVDENIQTRLANSPKSWTWNVSNTDFIEDERVNEVLNTTPTKLQKNGKIIEGMVTCLKDVFIEVPIAIREGNTAILRCDYDLEQEALYTVKWYKGRQEFFRYVPKELPHTRVFPLATINVDVSESGPKQVVLRQVTPELDGKYRCEVSADAPTFHTQIVAAWMHVVRTMDGKPELYLEKPQYSLGEKLRANCSSPPSNPPANITWFINDKELGNGRIIRIPSVRPSGQLFKTVSSIEYDVLIAGKLKVKCQSDIYHVIGSETEVMLDEDKPRLASILQPHDHSAGLTLSPSFRTIVLIIFAVIR